MSKIETGGPAFPVNTSTAPDFDGITIRDYFAAKAMQAMCGEVSRYDQFKPFAKDAYKMADAMMEARK